ncbi:MAG: hypothetical protein KGO02_06015 [Alphaproteobacteria bacterium]|nr:hypothetical protein [Alphaproteobacteria bacterium]
MQLFELDDHPNQIAVSKTDSLVVDGVFFFDFSRPIEVHRWLGTLNRWLGFVVGMRVPVSHQGEQRGSLAIGIHRSDPRFADVRALWKAHYPSRKAPPTTVADGIKIIVDFAKQFPNDC